MEISNFFSCFFCLCVLSFFLIVKTATNKQTKGTFLFPSSDEGEVKREQENNRYVGVNFFTQFFRKIFFSSVASKMVQMGTSWKRRLTSQQIYETFFLLLL